MFGPVIKSLCVCCSSSLTHVFFSTGLMSVPRDANLSELVVAERAVATKSRKNVQAKCTTIKLLFQAQLHLLW